MNPYITLLRAVIQLAYKDLKSRKYRADALAFFSPGGGLDQWKERVKRGFYR